MAGPENEGRGGGFLVILFGTVEYDGRAQRMIEVLSRFGQPITLVDTVASGHGDWSGFAGVERVALRLPRRTGRVIPHVWLLLRTLRTAWRVKPDVVVAEDFFTTGTAWLAASLVGSQVVYDAHELIIPDGSKRLSLRDRVWYLLERWVVNHAAAIVAANPERAEVMANHYGLTQPLTYMRNIPPLGVVSAPAEDIALRYPQLGVRSESERVILYQGSVALDRGLWRFVEALTYLPPEYRMVIAGDGPDLERLQSSGDIWIREGRLVTLGRVPQNLLRSITERAHVGIVSYPATGLNNVYCSPNKLFEYAQAKVPVVATDQPTLRSMIERYGIGMIVAASYGPERLAVSLQEVAENKLRYQRQLARFVQDHQWETEADRVYRALAAAFSRVRGGS